MRVYLGFGNKMVIKILGIETSCDETSAAIVGDNKKIYAHKILSQIDLHQQYGGVVPEVAARSHMEHLDMIISTVMAEAEVKFSDLDAIAVTAGPGLIGGVIVGVMYAKSIAAASGKPIIAVNHLEGHVLTVKLTHELEFPFILMLTSGGHCQVVLAEDIGKYKILGSTRDDAVGECFDKVAKMLGLAYPGGPNVEIRATHGDKNRFKFPKPMINDDSCDFSFSGLKSAAKRQIDEIKQKGSLTEEDINDICASLQHTIALILCDRMLKALTRFPDISNVVLAGGVAANNYIRTILTEACNKKSVNFLAPPISLCGDNAAMIAWAGIERYKKGFINNINFAPKSRWSLEDLS